MSHSMEVKFKEGDLFFRKEWSENDKIPFDIAMKIPEHDFSYIL